MVSAFELNGVGYIPAVQCHSAFLSLTKDAHTKCQAACLLLCASILEIERRYVKNIYVQNNVLQKNIASAVSKAVDMYIHVEV